MSCFSPRRVTFAMLVFVGLGPFISVSVVACASDTTTNDGPPPLSTGGKIKTPNKPDASSSSSATTLEASTPIEGKPGATTYVGKLAASDVVKFGGEGFCDYTITLQNIEIEVAALASGEIIAGVVRDLAVEEALPPCPYGAIPPSNHSYALTTTTPTAGGVTLAFEGATSNQPATSLFIDLVRTPTGYEASAGWKRTDIDAPFDWQVRSKITLAAKK